MQLKIRIVDAKFLQFTYEGHILVLVPTGGDLLTYTYTLLYLSTVINPREFHFCFALEFL